MSKKLFVNMYNIAKRNGDERTKEFVSAILEVYEKFEIDPHIVWKK